MSVTTIKGVGGRLAGAVRRKPQLLVKGARRKAITKLLHYLTVVSSQDTREALQAEKKDYSPLLFRSRGGSNIANAQTLLVQRCRDLLSAKA